MIMGVFVITGIEEEQGEAYFSGSVVKGVIRAGMEAVSDQHMIVVRRLYDESSEEMEELKKGITARILVVTQGDWKWAQSLIGQQITFTSDKKETNPLAWQVETI
ncbi:MAG: hypothetical protein V1846_03515 [Candidatus Komeilibacteria bacterium]